MKNNKALANTSFYLLFNLEKREGMCDVRLSEYLPAPRHTIVGWEQKYSCMLPEDLKSFYLTTDGLLLTWSVNLESK